MSRSFRSTALALAIALGAGACGETPTASETDATLDLNKSAGPVVASATGSWVISGVRVMTFTARQNADGSVSGKWERVNQPGINNNGDVVCLNIVGNQAWIGTIARNGPWAGFEGGFRVIDNGEGANDPPDQASLQVVNFEPGGAADYCANTPEDPGFFDVGAGNVQIRQ